MKTMKTMKFFDYKAKKILVTETEICVVLSGGGESSLPICCGLLLKEIIINHLLILIPICNQSVC